VTETPQPSDEITIETPARKPPTWLIPALAIVGSLFLLYLIFAQHRTNTELTARLDEINANLQAVTSRATTLENNYAELRGEFDVTSEKLGMTQQELARARSVARQIREEQRRTATQLGTQIQEHQAQLGSLTGEVSDVRGSVVETQEQLEETQTRLQRTIGDMGLQSGLIARNREELEELKRRGGRDYFEFDIRKSKQYTRVGLVSIRLNKTDTKRQKFTMTLLESDKRIEKKDKTLLEPVQFYMPGTRHLLEIVVFDIEKNHITGYLSAPKEIASARR
jgi:multidrug efflux pump subunit AcrA (membrane-fusion protein)